MEVIDLADANAPMTGMEWICGEISSSRNDTAHWTEYETSPGDNLSNIFYSRNTFSDRTPLRVKLPVDFHPVAIHPANPGVGFPAQRV
jgi:hypothetical protein